ncbi:hypothetical protein QF026_000879 [Streptomyces aurantiacus]|uniref:hypothetical protein n=1 Tax=Streptomyces aurantiacus TaxID=47760 RepID=UPI0027906794|nr:hypothetical protein [Streptomyces aurantiacus]MDQ0772413.1 hypothetical protein [Streptomyces aurantiacus]
MSEVESAATELKSQYAAQVSADLDRNTKEQERIGAEVVALEEQLRALRHDQTLLAELQRALGGDGSTPAPSVPRQATAAKRKKAATTKPAAKPAATKAAGSGAPKAAADSTAGKPDTAKSAAAKPTLVELIREHLGRQSEPRSSAEVATALAEAHPEREIKPKVVRTTVEGLVAKGQVQRTKQGSSVFYTTSKTTPADKEQ